MRLTCRLHTDYYGDSIRKKELSMEEEAESGMVLYMFSTGSQDHGVDTASVLKEVTEFVRQA